MYSSLLGSFLSNINALRYYISSVDQTIKNSINNIRHKGTVSKNEMIALLMKACVNERNEGADSFAEKMSEGFPDDMSDDEKEKYRIFFSNIERLVKELNFEDENAYAYSKLTKELKGEYQKLDSIANQKRILYNGSFMLLITYYEHLIASLFKKDFSDHPERIHLDSKSVTYKIMMECNDLEAIKERLVENEVMEMMYKSHDEWMKFFTDKVKIDIPVIKINGNELKEIIARRNLLVHNNGCVNSIYLSITGKKDVQLGDVLTVGKVYLNNAIDLIEASGMSLLIELWLKEYGKDDTEIEKISDILFSECLENKKWELGKQLYGLCCKCKQLSEADILIFKINMWQCFKWLGQIDEVRKDIDKLDVSSRMPRYKLAVLALRDEEEKFWKVYDTQNDINEEQLKNWPLFNSIREGEIYKMRFIGKSEESTVQITEKAGEECV